MLALNNVKYNSEIWARFIGKHLYSSHNKMHNTFYFEILIFFTLKLP